MRFGGIKKTKRYTYQSAYKDYLEIIPDKSSALTYPQFCKVIPTWCRKLDIKIIHEPYEWKIPYGGGYLRISKNDKGFFYWYWDRANSYCKIKKKRMWSFKAVDGWNDKEIGDTGLKLHYFECKNNPRKAKYDVPIINHRTI